MAPLKWQKVKVRKDWDNYVAFEGAGFNLEKFRASSGKNQSNSNQSHRLSFLNLLVDGLQGFPNILDPEKDGAARN